MLEGRGVEVDKPCKVTNLHNLYFVVWTTAEGHPGILPWGFNNMQFINDMVFRMNENSTDKYKVISGNELIASYINSNKAEFVELVEALKPGE